MFPPAKKSFWCTKQITDVNCDPVEWSIKVPVGTYTVKVTFGDTEKAVGYCLNVNGHSIISGDILRAD